MKFLKKLICLNGNEEIKDLKDKVIEEREKDIKQLHKINKTVKLLLAEGSIEVTVRNVRGVIESDYCKKKKKK